jgi:hypothetical protein
MTLHQVGTSVEFSYLFGRLKDPDYWNNSKVNLSLKRLCLLKEVNMPIAMNTNSFPQIINLLCV